MANLRTIGSGMSVRGMVFAAMFAALTAVGAFIMIPIGPAVPITMQTLFVHLSAALLGSHLGALSQFIYVLVGVMGLPVFAGGASGLGILLGPRGGYLIGFVAGAYITGKLIEMREKPGFLWIAMSCVAGLVVIYIVGMLQLSIVADLPVTGALAVGVVPFLIGDAIKIIAATFITLKLRGMIKV